MQNVFLYAFSEALTPLGLMASGILSNPIATVAFLLDAFFLLYFIKWLDNLLSWRFGKIRLRSHCVVCTDTELSALDFYDSLVAKLTDYDIEGISFARVNLPDGGPFSSSHKGVRVSRKRIYYDVYVAGFSTGIYIAWWKIERLNLFRAFMAAMPRIGIFWRIPPVYPYYHIDTDTSFGKLVEDSVEEVSKEMLDVVGIRTDAPLNLVK